MIIGQPLLVGLSSVKWSRATLTVSHPHRPEPVVKQPWAFLQGEAVPDVVVPRVGELMDMGGVDDAARRDGHRR